MSLSDYEEDWEKEDWEAEMDINQHEDTVFDNEPKPVIVKKPKKTVYNNLLNTEIKIKEYKIIDIYKQLDENNYFFRNDIRINPVPNSDSKLYIEAKKTKKEIEFERVICNIFDYWQQDLANKIFDRKNILLNIATSCGKSWAVRKIVCETILPTEKTALFILPNLEVLIEYYQSIIKSYRKTYKYTKKLIGIETLNKRVYDRRGLSSCQIICTTADNVLSLFLDKNMDKFTQNLKFIVFDEAHISKVFKSFQLLSYLSLDVQYILLSATISNSDEVLDYMNQVLDKETCLIKYAIRPIPLQKTLFKQDIKLNAKGALISKSDLESSTLTLYENLNDPTIRDVKKLMQINNTKEEIPDTREKQFKLGMNIVENLNQDSIKILSDEQNQKIIDCNNIETPENILILLQSLLANNMGPIIIFNKSFSDCISLGKNLLRLLENYELSDHNVKKAMKYMDVLNKNEKKKMDKAKSSNKNSFETPPPDDEEDNNDKLSLEEKYKIFINEHLYKWKFKSDIKKRISKYEWINELLSFGIGIHCKGIQSYTRTNIFNSFNDKKIEILIADETLAVGVNLPVRTVIIQGDIDMTNYTHMAGRAGRRGLDDQGYIIPLMNKELIKTIYNSKKLIQYLDVSSKINMLDLLYLTKYYDNVNSVSIYNNIKNDFDMMEHIKWIYSYNIINDDITDLAMFNNNHMLLNLGIIIKQGILHRHIKKFNKDILDMLSLLSMIIQVKNNTTNQIEIKSEIINNFISEFNSDAPEEFKFKFNIDNYIIEFYLNGKCENKDSIGVFQRTLFNLSKYLETKFGERDILVDKIKKIDALLWQKCQNYNIKV
jgi:replicative superfamily II helicase